MTCNNVGVTCADGLGNVDIINNVFSLEQCRVECVAREDCQVRMMIMMMVMMMLMIIMTASS